MVDSKAEDDDDGFVDFTFASFPKFVPHFNQINRRKSTPFNDDDDWGDFVESPLRSEFSSGIFKTQPPSIVSVSSKPPEPFGIFSDQSSFTVPPTELTPTPTESQKTHWVNPKGALLPSVFGDVHQEKEQSDVVDFPFGDAKYCAADIKHGTEMVVDPAVNEVMSNLYKQIKRGKDENGFKADPNGSDPNVIEINSNLNGASSLGMNSISELFAGNNDIQIPYISTVSGVSPNTDISSGNNNPQSQQIKAVTGLNTHSVFFGGQQMKGVSGLNSYSSGMVVNMNLFSGNIEFDGTTNLRGQDHQNNFEISNGLSSNLSTPPIFMVMDSCSDPVGGNGEFDADYAGWQFKDAYSASKGGVSSDKVNEIMSNNHKEALPLSIFGDEELETHDSLNVQDAFTFKSYPKNCIISQGSNISINDLISNLYSQAEHIPPVDHTGKHTENVLDSSDEVMDLSDSSDFEDASWDFKDASIQTSTIDQTSLLSHGDTHYNFTTNLNMINYVDFYCKLKDVLSFVCRGHLDNLKRAKHIASLSGEYPKVAVIEEEIQEACKELLKENIYYKECSEDELPRDAFLSEFIEISKTKFQILESEYGLSGRLHLAEKDLRSAVELMKHTTSMLHVLRLKSMEDQGIYVSTWSKMISVCAQELKHGSRIWKQLVEKNIQSEILSETRGKRFILTLGEIYRVVAVLGASAKLYKPWILSSSVDSTYIYALLEECCTIWSTSRIEEALQHMSDPIDFDYHSTVKALQESIRFIRGHDELALGNHIFDQQVSVCRLSLLTSEAVPEIKMVLWNHEYYFLPLANLWANLISCDPPHLS